MSSYNKIKIFLASSGELAHERKEVELFIGKENKKYIDENLFLDLVIWEDLKQSFSGERIQDYFNEEMLKCEIVVVLIFTKVGEFTKEEFDKAYEAFKSAENPKYLYVYFKDVEVKLSKIPKEYMDVIELKEEIQSIEQIYCPFDSIDNLTQQLNKQLNLIIPELKQNKIDTEESSPPLSTPTFSKLEEINSYIHHVSKKDKYYDEKNYILKIEEILKEDNSLSTVSCTGMGGVGKSTLTIEYANYALEKGIYDYAIWLGIESGLEVAIKLFVIRYLISNDDGKQEMAFYINSFVSFVNQEHKVVMIFDNYNSSSVSKEELHTFLQRVKSQDALLTSREKTKLENQRVIEVDVFENVDDALKMFEKCSSRIYSDNEKEVLKEIMERLGLLPLAIEITAIYLSEYTDINVKEYFDDLSSECVTTLEYTNEEYMPIMHKDNIRATLKIASNVQENQEMLLYLKLFSLLSAEPISEEIFKSIVTQVQNDVSTVRFKQTLGDLKKFYYIKQENNDYVMHRLLQEVIAEEYLKDADEKKELLTAISLAILWWMKKAFDDNQYGAYFDQQMAHVNHLLEVCENITVSNEIKSYLLTCKSAYANTKASKADVVYMYAKEAVDLMESFSIKAEAVIRKQYANALTLKDEYNLALKEYNIVLDIQIDIFGKNHSDIIDTYNNMGLVYDRKGEYDLALEEYNKALNIASTGEKYQNIEATYNNIGSVYKNQGNYDLALTKYSKALDINIATRGKNHPDTATTYNNIGLVYDCKGEYDLALEEYNKALKIKIATIGENHPDTAPTYNNIGLAYDHKAEYDLALKEYNKSLKIKIATIGESNLNVRITHHNIAAVYFAQNKFYKAYKSMVSSLEILLKAEKSVLIKVEIKKSFRLLNDFMNKAQRNTNKEQKIFMQKKSKEIKTEIKRLKIKL